MLISGQRMLVLQCLKESLFQRLILRLGNLGENLDPAQNDEGVFCDQNFPRKVAVHIQK